MLDNIRKYTTSTSMVLFLYRPDVVKHKHRLFLVARSSEHMARQGRTGQGRADEVDRSRVARPWKSSLVKRSAMTQCSTAARFNSSKVEHCHYLDNTVTCHLQTRKLSRNPFQVCKHASGM